MEKMKTTAWWWGRSCSVDLHGLDDSLIHPEYIRKYVRKLCTLLNMKRHGPTEIGRFGKGKLRGYSMMQFIETSSITAHFDDKGHRAFIDIFSCKQFNPRKVARFSQKFFKAQDVRINAEERL